VPIGNPSLIAGLENKPKAMFGGAWIDFKKPCPSMSRATLSGKFPAHLSISRHSLISINELCYLPQLFWVI
jgi:hypothetical protein